MAGAGGVDRIETLLVEHVVAAEFPGPLLHEAAAVGARAGGTLVFRVLHGAGQEFGPPTAQNNLDAIADASLAEAVHELRGDIRDRGAGGSIAVCLPIACGGMGVGGSRRCMGDAGSADDPGG